MPSIMGASQYLNSQIIFGSNSPLYAHVGAGISFIREIRKCFCIFGGYRVGRRLNASC